MKKQFKGFIVSFIVIVLLCSPLFAYGYVKTDDGEATLLQEGEYELNTKVSKDYSSPVMSLSSAEEAIYNSLLEVLPEIDLTIYSVSCDDIDALLSNVINDNPDLFYVSSSFSFSYYPSNNTVAKLMPCYAMSKNEIAQAKEIFDSGVKKALSCVDSSMSDIQKALAIHEYICNLAVYPEIVFNEDGTSSEEYPDKDIYHSAYGFFKDNTVVCAGYTLAYSYLMNLVGVQTEYVSSDAMAHAWNKIKIGDNWYNVDLTYDDFNLSHNITTYGAVRHSHFLKSDSYISSEKGSCHYGYVTYDDCIADDTSFDSAFWDDVTSRIYILDGSYYYLKPNSAANGRVTLTKRSANDDEKALCSDFYTAYSTYSTRNIDENGETHISKFVDNRCRLAYLDNRFYVASKNSVFSVLLNGTKYTITSISGYPVGLSVNDSNNLIYQLSSTYENFSELDKLEYFKNYITAQSGENYNNYPDINLDNYVNAKDYAYIINS